jgi:hypothetical protein
MSRYEPDAPAFQGAVPCNLRSRGCGGGLGVHERVGAGCGVRRRRALSAVCAGDITGVGPRVRAASENTTC